MGMLQPHQDWGFEDRAFVFSAFLGVGVIWAVGFVVLRRNQYFVSETSFGFCDVFRRCEIKFDDVVRVTVRYGFHSVEAQIVANGRTTNLSVDWTTNGEWWKLSECD